MDKSTTLNIIQEKINSLEYELLILKEKLQKEKDDTVDWCPKCRNWYDKKNLSYGKFIETKTEVVFSDAGYGDDDILADVTSEYHVIRCPKCGYELSKKKFILNTSNERGRH